MANFALCIAGYQTLVTKIVQTSLRLRAWGGLKRNEKLFKDRIQMSTELRKKKYQLKNQNKTKGKVAKSRKNPLIISIHCKSGKTKS